MTYREWGITTIVILIASLLKCQSSIAVENEQEKVKKNIKPAIITLSPHLTEIVFALGLGDNIIAVSDYSDYPKAAENYPSVASYQGANLAEIYRLRPSHILVWKGGNKDTDIEHLKNQDYLIYESSIETFNDLLQNITEIGEFLNSPHAAYQIVGQLKNEAKKLSTFQQTPITAVYYLNEQPLIGLGNDPWLNNLLSMCHIDNVYKSSSRAYPQLNLSNVLRKQPEIIISANSQQKTQADSFWRSHRDILDSEIFIVDPDALHRFTPRAIYEISSLCNKIQQSKQLQ